MFKSVLGKISRTGRKLSELTGAELQVSSLFIELYVGKTRLNQSNYASKGIG